MNTRVRCKARACHFLWLLSLVGLVMLCNGGCRAATDGDQPANKITLQLNWRADAQHGGFYAALLHGDYREEGLEVEIIEGGPGTPVIPKLVMGRVDFAIANADQILQAREQEADLIGIFAPLQHSPRCIMVHRASGITSLHELRNLTLAMNEGRTFAIFLKANLTLDNVRIVPYGGTIAKFMVDPNYAQQAYVFSEPIVAARQGSDPQALPVTELGFDPYTSVLAIRRQLWAERPEVVKKFVAASIRGWERYLEAPATTNREIVRLNPDMDLESLQKSVELLRPLCMFTDLDGQPADVSNRFGTMTATRWRRLAEQMKSIDAISNDPAQAADKAWIAIENDERLYKE